MQIRNGIVIEDDFIAAFNDLMMRDMPVQQCHELSICLEELASHLSVLKRTKLTLIQKYASKDPRTEQFLMDPDGNVLFPDEKIKVKCATEINEIMSDHIDIPLTGPIVIYKDEKMTPRKYALLKDIIKVVDRPKEN